MYGGHWWGMGFGWLTGLVFIVLIIWLIVRVVNQDSYRRNRSSSALDILKERYARGEISKEEFEEKRKHIEQ
jgi:putative membrane protein